MMKPDVNSVTLKKPAAQSQPPPPVSDSRSDLMNQIRGGAVKLRKVTDDDINDRSSAKGASNTGGLMGALTGALKDIEGVLNYSSDEDTDNSDDEDWGDED